MLDKLCEFFRGKKTLILGFGLEGRSTLRLLEELNCAQKIAVADKNAVDARYPSFCGEDYLEALNGDFDVIMKTPGIALFDKFDRIGEKITSQTDLFLRFRENVTVGITGTKGKSTTSSLLRHILVNCGKKARLIGNIGVPPLEICLEETGGLSGGVIVFEMSCHQLEYVKASPDVAVLLNVYEEHLDHYADFGRYRAAKENIFKYQKKGDISIRADEENAEISRVERLLAANGLKLRGAHNLRNAATAVYAAELLGCGEKAAVKAAESFGGLPHRLELFAEIGGVKWVDDSISTVPAAAIAAVKAFPETDTLIVGGMDRGIDYAPLTEFLNNSGAVDNVIALPDSGHKVAESLDAVKIGVYKAKDMTDAVNRAKIITKSCCVLSPAAASYGFYKNFEERGEVFKNAVLGGSPMKA
ncbi:MAG: UDP-N-acetylmuramoyl-L-alanine--D-glutamate ligase [Oscillospiraceae bacterium]|jgi:UDP-N-acetylmuramoylalanine--D-glutamate ligase|nr:UDP-N-acetylmuramoyl-L-alanine--D-glutamate ligase [Oscillospiraceae bacterium]